MIKGRAKLDGIAVGEVTISFLGSTLTLDAKAAFVDTRTGDTYGWTKNTTWSPQTIEKLKELRALMELDLGRIHFEDGGEVLTTRASGITLAPEAERGGLGEHLSEE